MTSKIFSFIKITEDSMVASSRLARYISDYLKIPICWDESISDDKLDKLIIVNGAFAFTPMSVLESLGTAIQSANKIAWVQNDYTIIPPKHTGHAESPFRRAFRIRHEENRSPINYWTTVKHMANPGQSMSGHIIGRDSMYINWNALTLADPITALPIENRYYGKRAVYYGSFRKDRLEYFQRYFSHPSVDMIISSPSLKFGNHFSNHRIINIPKFQNIQGFLSQCGIGLYLEDKRSHTTYHSPANRFYEMLSANLAMIFQPESQQMMAKSGYEISQFIGFGSHEIATGLENADIIRERQMNMWWEKALYERKSIDLSMEQAWSLLSS